MKFPLKFLSLFLSVTSFPDSDDSLISVVSAQQQHYTDCGIIGDAGSTGTRIYVAYDIKNDPKILSMGKQQGGLAIIGAQVAFEGRVDPNSSLGSKLPGVAVLLEHAVEKMKELGCVAQPQQQDNSDGSDSQSQQQNQFPLAILGTAGTRKLPRKEREDMWLKFRELIQGEIDSKGWNVRIVGLETIPGEAEGYFAFLSVNILKKALSSNTEVIAKLHGVVDLGGASTQVAVPLISTVNNQRLTPSNLFVRSYLGYGTKEFFQASSAIKEACQFGTPSDNCQKVIKHVFLSRSKDGATELIQQEPIVVQQSQSLSSSSGSSSISTPKTTQMIKYHRLGKSDLELIRKADEKTASVYAISGFYYTVKFMQGIGAMQKENNDHLISLEEVNQGAMNLCSMGWQEVLEKWQNDPELQKNVDKEGLVTRCYDASYASVLLQDVYGWSQNEKKFFFTDEVNHNAVDWPLGAYLMLVTGELRSILDQTKYRSKTIQQAGSVDGSGIGGVASVGKGVNKNTSSDTSAAKSSDISVPTLESSKANALKSIESSGPSWYLANLCAGLTAMVILLVIVRRLYYGNFLTAVGLSSRGGGRGFGMDSDGLPTSGNVLPITNRDAIGSGSNKSHNSNFPSKALSTLNKNVNIIGNSTQRMMHSVVGGVGPFGGASDMQSLKANSGGNSDSEREMRGPEML